MTELTPVQIKLAEQLLLSVKKREINIEYNELAARIDPPIHWRHVGKNIGEISKLCHELGLPLLSAKVVNKGTHKAGEGFYPLYEILGIPTKGKTEEELYHEERAAIRECKEWYKLEEYLGLHIGFERPKNLYKNTSTSTKVAPQDDSDKCTGNQGDKMSSNNCSAEPSYMHCTERGGRYLDARKSVPFERSVDIINTVLFPNYIEKRYEGYQRGGLQVQVKGTPYFFWFPKIAQNGQAGSASGWINTIEDHGCTIIEERDHDSSSKNYGIIHGTRFVFAKNKNDPYYFIGVFVEDTERTTLYRHVYKKIADVVDLTESEPRILCYAKEQEEDQDLISAIRDDLMIEKPTSFEYVSKMKTTPILVAGHRVYKRDKRTAINALSHAGYQCEIDHAHPTFLRKNSDKAYTEPHHLIPMEFSDDFEVSLDVEANIVSLCSNCHNQIHYGQGADALIAQLYHRRRVALEQAGIHITLEKLFEYYRL